MEILTFIALGKTVSLDCVDVLILGTFCPLQFILCAEIFIALGDCVNYFLFYICAVFSAAGTAFRLSFRDLFLIFCFMYLLCTSICSPPEHLLVTLVCHSYVTFYFFPNFCYYRNLIGWRKIPVMRSDCVILTCDENDVSVVRNSY